MRRCAHFANQRRQKRHAIAEQRKKTNIYTHIHIEIVGCVRREKWIGAKLFAPKIKAIKCNILLLYRTIPYMNIYICVCVYVYGVYKLAMPLCNMCMCIIYIHSMRILVFLYYCFTEKTRRKKEEKYRNVCLSSTFLRAANIRIHGRKKKFVPNMTT